MREMNRERMMKKERKKEREEIKGIKHTVPPYLVYSNGRVYRILRSPCWPAVTETPHLRYSSIRLHRGLQQRSVLCVVCVYVCAYV